MGKHSNLIHEYRQTLQFMRKGAYATRQNYEKVMRTITDDLCHLRIAPRHWSQLTASGLTHLVEYWQSQKNTASTIANKLSILRSYYKTSNILIEFPSNKALGLKKAKLISGKQIEEAVIDKIHHPICKTILEFEINFGLTTAESISIKGCSFRQHNQILITRKVASNSKERHIPIVSDNQKTAINNRLNILAQQTTLTDLANTQTLSNLYRAELAIQGIKGHTCFRRLYAIKRYSDLLETNNADIAFKIVREELGLSSNQLLKGWISEQN